MCATPAADGAAQHARQAAADGRAGVRVALQRLRLGADQRRPRAGLQLGPGDRRDGAGGGEALPADFGYEWTGITYQELKAGSVAAIVFALALVFVFLFLAAQYESWSMPFMVHPGGAARAVRRGAALWLRGMQIDVYSQIGFVMLIGLSAKNAILIVEFAKRLRDEGHGIVEAAMEAGRLRLRPILMTAFAFILGVVPLMVAAGAGAGSRQSIGTTVFGGMLAATLLGLAFVPVFYAVIERLREGRELRSSTSAGQRPEAPSASDTGGQWTMRVSRRTSDLGTGAVALFAIGVALLGSSGHGAARAAGGGAARRPCRCRWRAVDPADGARSISTIVGTTEAIRSVTLQAKVTGYLAAQGGARRRGRAGGRTALPHRPARLIRRRSTRRARRHSATPRRFDYARKPASSATRR